MTYAVFSRDDVTAKVRIRQAAFELIAEKGPRGATIRGIATRSGVSPGLVLHHFGSKQGVVGSVSAWVLDLLESATADTADTDDPARAHEARLAGFDQLAVDVPLLPAYLRRTIMETTTEGVEWFRTSVDRTAADLERREKAGGARSSHDRQAEATILIVLALAPVLLKPLLERALDIDLDDAAARARWNRASSELLTSGPLYPPATPLKA